MECLNALAEQEKVDNGIFEVIVVNDGGEEVLPASLGTFKDKIDIRYYSQDHKGPAAARNLGIEMARGEIILLLDDDSLPTSDWLYATHERTST